MQTQMTATERAEMLERFVYAVIAVDERDDYDALNNLKSVVDYDTYRELRDEADMVVFYRRLDSGK